MGELISLRYSCIYRANSLIWFWLVKGKCSLYYETLESFPWKNTVLLTRLVPSILMLVINCSASGAAIAVSVWSLWSSFVTVIVFEIVIFCCVVEGNYFSISEAQFRYACARFSADLRMRGWFWYLDLIVWIIWIIWILWTIMHGDLFCKEKIKF